MTAVTIPPRGTSKGADLHETATSSSSAAPSSTVVAKKSTPRVVASRGRKAPYPNSILDRRVLQQALDDRGLVVKPIHIEGFYQALHRQHYPDLPDFVEQFERFNQDAHGKKGNNNTNTTAVSTGEDENNPKNNHWKTSTARPLKNAVSRKKNRNRVQLPKTLLAFLKDPDNGLVTVTSKVAVERTSADGSTTKLAIQLHDGQQVESV